MLNPHIETLIDLFAKQAAKQFLQAPELVNAYYLLPDSQRPLLIEKGRTILKQKELT